MKEVRYIDVCLAKFNKLKEEAMDLQDNLRRHYIGKDAILLRGKYKNRNGCICGISFDIENNIKMLVRPYRIHGEGDKLLNDHPDARTYWNIYDLEIK
jgi:hypothetical protein